MGLCWTEREDAGQRRRIVWSWREIERRARQRSRDWVCAVVVILLVIGALPVAVAAQSPWELLANQSVVLKKTCIGAEGVAETSAGVTAWIKDTYVSAQKLPGGGEFTIAKGELLVDCGANKWKMIRLVAYNGSGDAVFDDARPSSAFEPVVAGSVTADFTVAACSMAQMKRQWPAPSAP